MDLIPGTENLWNYSEGKKVEEISIHGNVTDLKKEICNTGFKINDCKFLRNVPESRTDCVFISLKLLNVILKFVVVAKLVFFKRIIQSL